MERSPIQPLTPSGNVAAPAPAQSPATRSSVATASTAAPTTGAAASATTSSSTKPRASNVTVGRGSSPIKKQERDPRLQPESLPCKLIFLNGKYEGKELDLGLAVNSLSQDQSSYWHTQKVKGVRSGINFDGIGDRTFKLDLEYWALSEDVFHLLENLATTAEIGDGEKQPPYMMLVQGSAQIAPVVSDGFSHTLSEPHPGRKGYRHGKCELKLKLVGGKDSEHALGKPLTATPLGDEVARQTQLERQRQSQQQVAQLLLAPCIGERGSALLTEMIDQNKLSDPAAIASLPPETLTQAAIAGIFSDEDLKSEAIAPLLRSAIASQMAAAEAGFGIYARQVAQGWINGDNNFFGISSPEVIAQARLLQNEFDQIVRSVTNQDFNQLLEAGNSAGERLRNFGACGLRLRNSGAVDIRSPKDEAGTLEKINSAIATLSDDDLRERFGITTNEEIRALRNGAPYQSRQALIDHMSRGASVDGVALWSRFESTIVK